MVRRVGWGGRHRSLLQRRTCTMPHVAIPRHTFPCSLICRAIAWPTSSITPPLVPPVNTQPLVMPTYERSGDATSGSIVGPSHLVCTAEMGVAFRVAECTPQLPRRRNGITSAPCPAALSGRPVRGTQPRAAHAATFARHHAVHQRRYNAEELRSKASSRFRQRAGGRTSRSTSASCELPVANPVTEMMTSGHASCHV
jgi:hypothetical protein